MINRVATFNQYQNLTSQMMRQQGNISTVNDQLATGKRVNTAGDDPVSSISIQNFGQQLTQTNQFIKTIGLANNRLGILETSVSNAETHIDSAKQMVLGMVNGSKTADDRKATQGELQTLYDSLLHLANSQDELGNYLFAGNQVSDKPFVENAAGKVVYQGDSGSRRAEIDVGVKISTSQPGNRVFESVKNPFGDYRPDYQGLQQGSQLHLVSSTNDDPADSSSYSVKFVDDGAGGIGYELYQGAGAVPVETGAYDPDKGIEYPSTAPTLHLKFDGEVKENDSIGLEPGKTISIFDSLQDAIKYADYPVDSAEAEAGLQRAIDDLSVSFSHMNQRRSEVGATMQALDRYESMHQDMELMLTDAKSGQEDLDISKAVIDLNQGMMALQASQAAFSQTKNLTLFNYL